MRKIKKVIHFGTIDDEIYDFVVLSNDNRFWHICFEVDGEGECSLSEPGWTAWEEMECPPLPQGDER